MRYPVYKWRTPTSGERPMYDSTFSIAPCLRTAREKHRFAAGKKHRNGKKHVWQQEKNAVQREKKVSAAGKNASKKCRFAARKIQSSRKNPLQQQKNTFAAEKMHCGGSGKKTVRGGKKPRPRQENKRPRQEKNQQQRKPSFATQKVAATEKLHVRKGKKQQPKIKDCVFVIAECVFATCGLFCPRSISERH